MNTKITKLAFALLTLSLLLIQKPVSAQNIGVGVIGGLSSITHTNNFIFSGEEVVIDIQPGYNSSNHIGLLYRYVLGRNLRLQTEPGFIQMGASYDDSFLFRGSEFTIIGETTLSYIQVPLLVQLTTTPHDKREFPKPWAGFTYHVTAGGYGGYLLDANFSGNTTGAPIGIGFESEFSNDVLNQYSEYDAGILVGMGVEYGLDYKMGLETRLLYGLTNSGNESKESNFNPHNLAINFSFYLIF